MIAPNRHRKGSPGELLDHDAFVAEFQHAPVDELPHRCAPEPLVSVIVITYNQAAFLRQTLDSILAQRTTFTVEICVGDDGSSDGTREICREYAARYPERMRVFLNSRQNNILINGRPTGRFNVTNLYMRARGRYIAFCEGDDFWTEPTKLARQVEFLEQHPDYSFTFHDADVVYAQGSGWARRHAYSEFTWCLMGQRVEYAADDLVRSPLCPTASVVFRRPELVRFPRWYFQVPSADIPMETLACGKGRIRNFRLPWCVYRKHKDGISAIHRGDFIHVGRIMTLFGLWSELESLDAGVIADVAEKHAAELRAGFSVYDAEFCCAMVEYTREQLAERNVAPEARDRILRVAQRIESAARPSLPNANADGRRAEIVAGRAPVKALFVAHGPDQVNGPNVWLTRLLPELRKHNVAPEVLMFMTRSGPCQMLEQLRAAGVKCHTAAFGYTEDMIAMIVAHVSTHRCDVFVPNLNVQAYFAAKYLKSAGIPTIGVLHSDDDFHRDLVDQFVVEANGEYLSAVVAVSKFQAESLAKLQSGGLTVLQAPYGAPVPAVATRRRSDAFRFVYVGRLVDEQKRICDTVRAMCAVLRQRSVAEFHICGDGTARPVVEALIAQSGVADRIHLHGQQSAAQVQDRLLESQAFVLLSDYEGIPIALMEAMAAGVVPICTRIRSGVGELIVDRENGLMVENRGDAFVAAALALVDDAELWERCSAAARARICSGFSVAANATAWGDLIRRLSSAAGNKERIALPGNLSLPPVRSKPKGIAREDRRKPQPVTPPAALQPFLKPTLEINNIDLYWTRASILNAVKQARSLMHGVLLDIGCGIMPYRGLIMEQPTRVQRYIGLDIETPIYKADVDLRWDGKKIPLPDGSIDTAMATEVLEHCPEPSVVLKEARRVLKPGGLLFFTVPYIWPLHDAPYDFYRYTPFALDRLLLEAGFTDIKIEALGGWNASVAQMIGLWLKRAPMSNDARSRLAGQLWPLYQQLVATDTMPSDSRAGNTMATGWTGIARVPAECTTKSGESKAEPLPVVLVRSHASNYSETFIEDHVKLLSAELQVLYGYPFPRFTGGGSSVFDNTIEAAIAEALAGRAQSMPQVWHDYTRGLAAYLKGSSARVALIETGLMGAFVHEACEQAGLPYVVHFHGVDAFGKEILAQWLPRYRRFFKGAAALVVVSQAMRAQLIRLGAPHDRIILGPYGVAVDLAAYARPAEAPRQFVAVGRFVEKKAPHLTLQAFGRVHAEMPDATLVMIGDGPLFAQCKRWVEENGLTSAVTFLGVQSRAEVSRVMAGSRAFVQHSVTAANGDSEGLPLAVLEAGAHGLPVVATRHAGIPDAVRDGVDGFLVPENDVMAMAAQMAALARDSTLANRLGASFQARVRENYSHAVSLDRLRGVLRAAMQPLRAAAAAPAASEPTAPAPIVPYQMPTGPLALVAVDRNRLEAYTALAEERKSNRDRAGAYQALGEAQRLGGETPAITAELRRLEATGALGEPVVEAYRRRAGWLPRRKSPKPRRILVVTNLLPPQEMGGFGRTMWEFSRELLARGNAVQVLTANLPHLLRKPTPEHAEFEGNVQRTLRLFGDWKDGRAEVEGDSQRLLQVVRENAETIGAAARKFRPDAVIAGNLDFVGHGFVQEFVDAGVPVIHRLGNARPGYEPSESPRSPLYCIAGCSEWVNQNIRAAGFPVSRFSVLPPGSPLTEYYRAFPPAREKLRIAFASLLMPYKGAHVLVEALGYLQQRGIDFDCTLAGDSTDRAYVERLQALAAQQGFAEKLHWPGFLAKSELAALFARSNTLVFPSVFPEPFGKTQIEAMAAGLLVISSGTGGSTDIVRHAVNGLTFENNNARDLAQRLHFVHTNAVAAEKLARQGQIDAFKFTTGASVDRLETLINESVALAAKWRQSAAVPA